MNKKFLFVKKFLLLATVTIMIVVMIIFFHFHIRTTELTKDILLQQGRALFSELIMTRRWVSEHGGVFVQVKPGVNPNPFLTTLPNLKVNITDEEKIMYTLRNPGLVVREISELAKKSGQFSFHISSLDPVNKKTNTPDLFEKKALQDFEKGKKEAFIIEQTSQGEFYRYMAPLLFENRCNKCHAFQKLNVGDIRGGISISIPMAMVNKKLKVNRIHTITSAAAVVGVLFLFLLILSRKFLTELNNAQTQLVSMATTDGLTKLYNRKFALERLEEEIAKHQRLNSPLSCLLLDIDYFKVINDKYGHQAGDAVLIVFASIMKKFSREYDIVSRYGGEEFMLILPSTELKVAIKVAERIRKEIAATDVEFKGKTIKATMSIGVAQMVTPNSDNLISHADAALYEAKSSGRNLVVASTEEILQKK
jgi:diguanylate cyclase (GGDEF)-like protein